MIKRNKIIAFFILGFTATIVAQGTPELKLTIEEQKVNMTPAERAGTSDIIYSPGDTIQYTILADNVGDGVMKNPVVVDPIPAGVSYLVNTAEGEDATIQFSINNGRNYQPWPVTYSIVDTDGKTVVREAEAEMVTHIKWLIDQSLAPAESKQLAFYVVVR